MFSANHSRFRFYNRRANRHQKQVTISLQKTQPSHQVDKRYLSFSIDISVLAGGYWWTEAKDLKKDSVPKKPPH